MHDIERHVVLVGHVVLVELELEVGLVGGDFLEADLGLVIEAVEAQTTQGGGLGTVKTDWMVQSVAGRVWYGGVC